MKVEKVDLVTYSGMIVVAKPIVERLFRNVTRIFLRFAIFHYKWKYLEFYTQTIL